MSDKSLSMLGKLTYLPAPSQVFDQALYCAAGCRWRAAGAAVALHIEATFIYYPILLI
jgi:hypothetical protein